MSLKVSTAPHIHARDNVKSIMRDVIIALIPASAVGCYYFGLPALMTLLVSVVSCVGFEFLWQKLTKQPVRINDLSAVVTGMILALNLPSTAPWWMTVVGALVAIIIVKQLFGGIGDNFLNPALAARAVLLASWPVRMTSYVLPTFFAVTDAVTSATPLAGYNATYMELFLGNIPGTIGEVCKAAILLGFVYLLIRRVIKPHIPVVFVAVAAICCYVFAGVNPLNTVLSGGLLFGAVFMATDYTTSPMTTVGQIIFAAGCGLMVALIRCFGAYPEGVTYAILLMNIATPLIDKYVKRKKYAEVRANA